MSAEPRGWRTSTYSSQETNCVEVGALPGGGAAVRDSKDRAAGHLTATATQWSRFLRALRA
ncbi:DUF397 domain-containing protein [Saccharopolyspora sp. MS10]|uniref:DUF397 domain-containing protein n=1 Tax=Saccharopolyspora sp. MS10 TaxID=3385973 RepID=UPI0039A16CA9